MHEALSVDVQLHPWVLLRHGTCVGLDHEDGRQWVQGRPEFLSWLSRARVAGASI
jgi:hypothetical protein